MAWLLRAALILTVAVVGTLTDGPSYSPRPIAYHPPAPSYPSHPPIYYSDSSRGKKGRNNFGKFLKDLRGGLSLFRGGGKSKGRGPVAPQHHVVNVPVPKCQPLTHYVTHHVTQAHPAPQVHTQFVEKVVPTVVYETKHERLVETSVVTDVVQQVVTVTSTKSVPVTRYSSVTEVQTEVRTSNVIQSTVEVSFTPLLTTTVLTQTHTVTRVETVPDVRLSSVTKSIYLPPTDYITVTEPYPVPSLLYETKGEHFTLHQTHYPPVTIADHYNHAAVNPTVTVTVTVTVREPFYQQDVSTVYRENYVTETHYQQQVVTQTEYQQITQVVTDYVTVQPDCGSGGGGGGVYSLSQSFEPYNPALETVIQQVDAAPLLPVPQSQVQLAPRLYGSSVFE